MDKIAYKSTCLSIVYIILPILSRVLENVSLVQVLQVNQYAKSYLNLPNHHHNTPREATVTAVILSNSSINLNP